MLNLSDLSDGEFQAESIGRHEGAAAQRHKTFLPEFNVGSMISVTSADEAIFERWICCR